MNSVSETLEAARAKIADTKHWTKRALARPSKYSIREVYPDEAKAGAWCALGAIKAVDGEYEQQAIVALARVIEPSRDVSYFVNAQMIVADFNDPEHRAHKDVLAKFDEAIAQAKARGE